MEILKLATEWAKDEIFSSRFFILAGIIFLAASLGFWQLGKTEVAKAFLFPMLVAGILLLIIGIGLVYSNKARISSFPTDYHQDAAAFVQAEINRAENTIKEYQTIVFKVIAEINRAENTIKEYQTIVFKVIPLIIVVAALVIMFVDKPLWRAIGVTTIAMMVVIIMIDSNAKARMEAYHEQLVSVENQD